MFVRMHNSNIMLDEITVRPNFLYKKFESYSLRSAKPLKAGRDGINFAYFTKEQKDERFHQVLLAKNKQGYSNLLKLTSLGYTEGIYGKYPRIDKELI